VYKEIQKGSGAKSYRLLTASSDIVKYLRISFGHLNFLIYDAYFLFFFIIVQLKAPPTEVHELPTPAQLMVVGSTDLTLLGWSSVEEPGRLPVEKLEEK
jgi:hypothetical protein